MQITLAQYESIQNYLDGSLTPPEERKFLNELNGDSLLKENLEFEKELRQTLAAIGEKKELFEKGTGYYETGNNAQNDDAVKRAMEKARKEWEEETKRSSAAIIKNIGDDPHGSKKTKVVNIKLWLVTVAAACAVLAIAGLALFMPSSPPPSLAKSPGTPGTAKDSNTVVAIAVPGDSLKDAGPGIKKIDNIALFRKHYAKDTANPPMPALLAMVPAAYWKGDISFRDIDLDALPVTRGDPGALDSRQNIRQFGHYYKGLSYLETGNNKRAVENLRWVIDSAQSRRLKIKAQWYLALDYLKEGNITGTNALLSALAKRDTAEPYQEEAAELLKKLQSTGKRGK